MTARTGARSVCSRPTSAPCRSQPCRPCRSCHPGPRSRASRCGFHARRPCRAPWRAPQPAGRLRAPPARPRPSLQRGHRRRWQYWPPPRAGRAPRHTPRRNLRSRRSASRRERRSDAGRSLRRRQASRPGDRCRGRPAAARSHRWPARPRGHAPARGARAARTRRAPPGDRSGTRRGRPCCAGNSRMQSCVAARSHSAAHRALPVPLRSSVRPDARRSLLRARPATSRRARPARHTG